MNNKDNENKAKLVPNSEAYGVFDENENLVVNGVGVGFGWPHWSMVTASWVETHLSQANESLATDQAQRSQILEGVSITEAAFLNGAF